MPVMYDLRAPDEAKHTVISERNLYSCPENIGIGN